MIRVLAFFLILVLQASICWAQNRTGKGEKGQSRLWLDAESKLTIIVSTNVNSFSCDYVSSVKSEAIEFEYLTKDHQTVEIQNASLKFPLVEFDCGQKVKNKEFGQLLNVKEYKNILINLNGLIIHQDDSLGTMGKFMTAIKISGLQGEEDIDILDILSDHRSSIYKGTTTINIRDYGLKPPVKFLGLVKVKEEVKIDFEFKFTTVQ